MSVESRAAAARKYNQAADTDISIYEQDAEFIYTDWEIKDLNVAVYCRVSTDSDEQATSFALQKAYYEDYVAKHPNWTLVDIFADEGISATSYKRRDDFNRMLNDCKGGRIDLIITKNVSRFSRNVVDCIGLARELLHAKHKVGIFFQEQGINTLTHGNEMILTIMAAIAQAESNLKSESMLWSIGGRFQRGQFLTPTNNLLGYYTDKEGNMQIEEEGAKTVRAIFKAFLAGCSLPKIAFLLSLYQRPTAKGNLYWSNGSVRNILQNEKMCGDVVAQKTYTVDVYSHKAAKNKGQKRSFYKRDHHPAIVSRKEYVQALMMLKSKRNSPYFNPDYIIQVVRKGLLAGFIPVNPAFGGYSPTHYMGAFEATGIASPPVSGEVVDVKNAKIARIQEFSHSTLAGVTITSKKLKFNQDCVAFFGEAEFVELLFHPTEWLLAVRLTTAENKNAVLWDAKPIAAAHLCKTFYTFCGWEPQIGYKVMADFYARGNERLLMFDLSNAEFFIKEKMKDITINESGEEVSVIKEVISFFTPESWDDFGKGCPAHAAAGRRWLAHALDDWLLDAPAENVPGFDNYETIQTDKELLFCSEEAMSQSFGVCLETENPILREVTVNA